MKAEKDFLFYDQFPGSAAEAARASTRCLPVFPYEGVLQPVMGETPPRPLARTMLYLTHGLCSPTGFASKENKDVLGGM